MVLSWILLRLRVFLFWMKSYNGSDRMAFLKPITSLKILFTWQIYTMCWILRGGGHFAFFWFFPLLCNVFHCLWPIICLIFPQFHFISPPHTPTIKHKRVHSLYIYYNKLWNLTFSRHSFKLQLVCVDTSKKTFKLVQLNRKI